MVRRLSAADEWNGKGFDHFSLYSFAAISLIAFRYKSPLPLFEEEGFVVSRRSFAGDFA
jgi:hypothetical protein